MTHTQASLKCQVSKVAYAAHQRNTAVTGPGSVDTNIASFTCHHKPGD